MRSALLVSVIAFIASTTPILVAPNSNCSVQCGNVLSSTSVADLSCSDGNYSTSAGQTFESCLNCEMTSTYYDPTTNQSDVQWFLYNLRYTVSSCVFGFQNPGFQDSPCLTSFSCGALVNAFEYGNLTTDSSAYDYCNNWNDVYVPQCTQCLQALGNENYLVNFVTALQAGCDQRPNPGGILGLQGSLFSATPVNITNPSPIPSANSSTSNSGGLSLGGKVGIAVGGLIFLFVLAGCCIVWRGKRRRRAILANISRNSYQRRRDGGGQYFEQFGQSPQTESVTGFMSPETYYNHKWYRQNESPTTHNGEQTKYSPYASPYSSPMASNRVKSEEWQETTAGSSSMRMSPVHDYHEQHHDENDNIELSPMSENEHEQWAREASEIGFSPSPIHHTPHSPTHDGESDGMGVAI